jgi:uncharacterized LabA/DUF88 family protein
MTTNKRFSNKKRDDLTGKLANLIKNKRVTVFIDAANVYHSANKLGFFISFESIFQWFQEHSKTCKLNFYTAFNPEDSNQIDFLNNLEVLGYHVVKKPIKTFADKVQKGNMDIELAVDALLEKDQFEIFILLSGDGDFSYLIHTLQKAGKITALIGAGGFTSFELHESVNEYFFLDRIKSIWQAKSTKHSENKTYYIFFDQVDNFDHKVESEIVKKSTIVTKRTTKTIVRLPPKKSTPSPPTIHV